MTQPEDVLLLLNKILCFQNLSLFTQAQRPEWGKGRSSILSPWLLAPLPLLEVVGDGSHADPGSLALGEQPQHAGVERMSEAHRSGQRDVRALRRVGGARA